MWLKAKHKAGLPVPWAYVRDVLAQRWSCKPWEVDAAPAREVRLTLRLMRLEAEYTARD